jgi:preprotein translocase subunit SecG
MEILRGLLVVLEGLMALLLIGVILLQKSRDQGLGMAFGANVGESLFGSRAGNVLTRATIWLGVAFVINTVILAMLFAGRDRSLMEGAEGARGDEPAATAPQTPEPADGAPAAIPSTEVSVPPAAEPPAAPAPAPVPETPPPVPPAPAPAP